MDNLSKEHRRKNMQNIRSRDTSIEKLMRSELFKLGYRYRKNYNKLPGKPDIVFIKQKVAIFLDSCFWHMCPYHFIPPKSNKIYWIPKLQRNKIRAKEVNKILKKNGWKVLRIWEHKIKKDFIKTIKIVLQNLLAF